MYSLLVTELCLINKMWFQPKKKQKQDAGSSFYHNVIIDLRYSVIYMHSTRHACEIIEQVSTLKDTGNLANTYILLFSTF